VCSLLSLALAAAHEAQQQLLRELQAQNEALEAALSGEDLRQLQAEIDSLRERGKAAGGNIMLLEAELRRLREDATEVFCGNGS
jgi:hypothetical protein